MELIILLTFLIGIFLGFGALKFFPKLGLMDRPHLYGHKREPIPYYGGIVIYLTFMIAVALFVRPLDSHVLALILGSTLVFLLGLFDDLFRLSPILRLFIQFLAALILVFAGIGVNSINLPFIGVLDFASWFVYGIPVMGAIFTILWVMTILNTMNFLDGISGLNSGVTVIASFTLFLLSIHPGLHEDPSSQIVVATLSLILAAVSLAFWFFDFPKPKILMGDSGSTFLGFILATLAIFSGGKVATAFLVLGIPVLDMIWVVLRRTFVERRKFWEGDLKHLHHRLLDLGFSERRVLLVYYVITAFFGITASVLVDSRQKLFMLISLLLLMLLLAVALILIPKRK